MRQTVCFTRIPNNNCVIVPEWRVVHRRLAKFQQEANRD